jgi:hypothetical protein
MRTIRKEDAYGQMMHWILSVKDYSTVLIWLSALPFKRAKFVNEIDAAASYPVNDTVKKIVGIIHKSSHYAVMEIDIKNQVSRIYDGLGVAPLLTSSQHILNALQM